MTDYYQDLPFLVGGPAVLRRATVEDATKILSDIRDEDVMEWEASVDGGIFHLEDCIRQSTEAITIADRTTDAPMVIFGCIGRLGPPSDIWMVASVQGPVWANVVFYLAKPWIDGFWERWPDVHCNSDLRNPVHHRWLSWLGFKGGPVRQWGVMGMPFIYFRRTTDGRHHDDA